MYRWQVSLFGMVLALLFLPFTCTGCDNTSDAVARHKYVVPDGYRGFFSIRVDPASGITPATVNGEIVFPIPSSGVLHTQRDYFTDVWEFGSAEFESGAVLPIEYEADPSEIALYSMCRGSFVDYLVGTEDDKYKAYTLELTNRPYTAGPLPTAPTYYTTQSVGMDNKRWFKNGRRHGIEIWMEGGECVRQEQWFKGKLVAVRKEPPWFSPEEVEASRR